MKKLLDTRRWALARTGTLLTLFVVATSTFAQDKACVTLKTEAQLEQDYVDAQGKPAKRLVAPGKVIPGNEIIWTITAANTCAKPAEKVVIENAVPEHMTYVADSALASGASNTITYSLNGRDFLAQAALTVREADGKTRPARPEEIKSIRWLLGTAIPPNATATARYRARVK
jgi:uncharacterized repeat protein (TIGR01451 family)